MHFPSASVAYLETSYIPFNDRFAAMQIVLSRHSAKRVGGLW